MEKKIVYAIDAVILVGTLFGIIFTYSTLSSPIALSPEENPWLFRYQNCLGDCWIFIDDNPEFSSPNEFYLEDTMKMTLEAGNYYWKVEGTFENQEGVRLSLLDRTEFFVLYEDDVYYIYVDGDVGIEEGNIFGGNDD